MRETVTMTLTDFLLARIAEDEARNDRSRLPGWHRRHRAERLATRRWCVLAASSWLSDPQWASAGEHWLRGIAKAHYRTVARAESKAP